MPILLLLFALFVAAVLVLGQQAAAIAMGVAFAAARLRLASQREGCRSGGQERPTQFLRNRAPAKAAEAA